MCKSRTRAIAVAFQNANTLKSRHTLVARAVLAALYATPVLCANLSAAALDVEGGDSELKEIVVTATRHNVTIEEVPYSITAVSADQIVRTGVTDMASLTAQVPGLSMYDLGGAAYSASVFPIIRGLNASAAAFGLRTFEQAPVGTYIGNSPIQGYFQLDDVERVEVLRGPQGTLYGAGSLGGAVRIIPSTPKLGSLSGNLEAGAGAITHSSGTAYTVSGVLNVPIGDTLAFRASGKYDDEPGFINVYGLLERTGSSFNGPPILANPADPVNSPGIFTGKSDWNYQKTITGRASLLWKPTDQFTAEFAFTYSDVAGDGNESTNTAFAGGPYPIDPRITFPNGGPYQSFAALDLPYSRKIELESLDLSFDAGFATLSSTSSYFTNSGSHLNDDTYTVFGVPAFQGYYAGNPANPRFLNPYSYGDSAHTFTQELRLVSNEGPDKRFDYVVGLYYEDQTSKGSQTGADPGSPARSVAQGCTAPYFYGASFPNCLVLAGPGDITFLNVDTQHFTDKSEFAELTWHFVPHGQITVGGRHFEQNFSDVQSGFDLPYNFVYPGIPHSAPASKNIWKINPAFEYATGQHVYALWSQGFRRGGAVSIPIAGPVGDNPSLLHYNPDSTDNYEVGLKGRLGNNVTYAVALFDIQWHNPQVGGTTPVGNNAVWNANKAESKGAEFDLNVQSLLPHVSLAVGGYYADAKFTQDYSIPTTYGSLSATAGQELPGSSKYSGAATVNYESQPAPEYKVVVSLNDTYRGPMTLTTFPGIGGITPAISGMNIVNLSASVGHQSWRVGAYVTNFLDKRAIQVPRSSTLLTNGLANSTFFNRPREISIRLGYSF